jgi:hypothetical protein
VTHIHVDAVMGQMSLSGGKTVSRKCSYRKRKALKKLKMMPLTISEEQVVRANMMSFDLSRTGPSHLPNHTGGRERSRVPTAAKSKCVYPGQKSGASPKIPVTSDTESDDDCDAQIRMDAEIATTWQDRERRRLKKEKRLELKNKHLRAKVKALEEQITASSKQPSTNTSETSGKSKKKKNHSSTAGSTGSSQSQRTHLHERPSKQLPKSSHLRQAMFEKGDSSDPNSSSSSSELSNEKPMNCPRRPIVSSDSERSLFPEEPDSADSDDSANTKRQKRREKRRGTRCLN